MSTDRKSNQRIDLNEIYRQCRDRSFYIATGAQLDTDRFAISGHEVKLMHQLAMSTMAQIADKAGYVKHHLATPIDAVTYYGEYEAYVDSDSDDVVVSPDQNAEYTANGVATDFYNYTITDDNNIFTTNVSDLSTLNDSHGDLSTSDIFVLTAQTVESENGGYRANEVGNPTKLTDLYEVIQVLTFSILPTYTLGEIGSDGTNSAKIIGIDTTNKKIVLADFTGSYFSGTATITGSTSTNSGTATSQTKHIRNTPIFLNVNDISGEAKDPGEKLDPQSNHDYIEFYGVDDLDDSNLLRWTVVQTYIKEAIIEGILYQWFKYVAQYDLSKVHASEFDRAIKDVKWNSVRTAKYVKTGRPYRVS